MAEHDTPWPVVVNHRRDEIYGIDEAGSSDGHPLVLDVENPARGPSRGGSSRRGCTIVEESNHGYD